MADGSGNPGPSGPIRPEMVREALAHLPFAIEDPVARWKWVAGFLNRCLANPEGPWCKCCGMDGTRGYP